MLDCEANDGNGHEQLVGHRVDNGADDGSLLVAPREVAVYGVGDARIEEERQCEGGLVGQNGIADGWGGEEACEG